MSWMNEHWSEDLKTAVFKEGEMHAVNDDLVELERVRDLILLKKFIGPRSFLPFISWKKYIYI